MILQFIRFLLLVAFFLWGTYPGSAQKQRIRFEHITKTTGLSQSTVYTITQDKFGFIWIGTADGLNRYDGYNIKKYYFDPDDPNSLTSNRIHNLLVDNDGDLWIATIGGGLNKYRVETDDFIAYRNNKKNPKSISSDIVMSLCQDKDGIIWVGTAEGGLNRFDKKKNTFTSYQNDPLNPNSIASSTIVSISSDKNGNIWLAFNKSGLDRFNPQYGTFVHYTHDPDNPNSISSNKLSHIFVDSRGLLWISTDNGLDLLNPVSSEIKRIVSSPSNPNSLRINDIQCVFEDRDHNIWVGTYAGLSFLSKQNLEIFKFENYFHNPLDPYSISNDLIRCIYQDNSGLFWVGNFSNGLDYFDAKPSIFSTFYHLPDDKKSLSNNIVRNIKQDSRGFIWIATFGGGLNRFDPRKGEFEIFRHNKSDRNSPSIDFLNAICIDENDNLWIGTYGGGLDFFNPQTKKFRHFVQQAENPNSLSNNHIRSMIFDKYGYLWIATSGGGLNRFNPRTEEFIIYRHEKDKPHSISDDRIMGLLEDHQGNIWIGSSSNGLNKFNIQNNTFQRFRNSPLDPKSIGSNRIYCIYETRDKKTLWIGTGDGLNRFNPSDSVFTRYTKKHGFKSDVILGILEDQDGFLWLSTMDGLYKFDPNLDGGKILQVFEDRDGLGANEFAEGAFFKDQQGKLYFGGVKGFSMFDPSKTSINKKIPQVYITDFMIFNKSVKINKDGILKKNILVTNELQLNYSTTVFSFEFTALNYKNPEKNQYMYKMDGFDNDWISTDAKRRFVTYTNLNPGSYTFKIKGSNNDGVWNEKINAIKIIIHPPFWKTWWFISIVVLIITACFIGFYLYRVASLKKQQKILEKTVAEKTTEILQKKEELENLNQKLKYSNRELFSQKEELKSINDELKETNSELIQRKNELEAALDSLQETQNRLIQSEKMASLGILAAGVAHEINNPLNFIQGGILGIEQYFSDKLKDHLPEITPLIKGVQEGVTRAASIVTSLNQYSRQDNRIHENCNIHNILDNCLNILHNELRDRIEMRKNYTPENYSLYANEGKLHQAFLNILSNAIQSIEAKGIISISTKTEKKNLKIVIEDNGCGINQEDFSYIFTPFYTTKPPGQGTGLGLAITYNIIKEHSGSIEIASKPGKGTKVFIELPIN